MSLPGNPGDQPANPKAAAAAAKAYAKATRPWFKKKRFIIPIVLVVLMIIGGLSGGGDDTTDPVSNDDKASSTTDDSTKTTTEPKTVKKEPKAEPKKVSTVKVRAADLLKAFEDNELAADDKYKDKTLEVSGRVNKIDTELLDDDKYVLMVGSGGEFEFLTVNCHDVPKSQLSALKTGQNVTVIGEFDDGGDLGVELQDCEVK